MSTARYRAFIAVAQQGSLSAAARALGVSQPTISSQIATLERQSQIELFHRQGYRMSLTGAGHKLLTLAPVSCDRDGGRLPGTSPRHAVVDSHGQLAAGAA